MKQYLELVRSILDTGSWQENRTGIRTISMPGAMLRFDLQQGFPAVTTKKLAFKSAVGELIGFMRASRSAADFRALGCKVWDANANENAQWLANPYRRGTDDLGDGKSHAEIERGVAVGEAGRRQSPHQDDGFAGDGSQGICRYRHGIRSMGDNDPALLRLSHPGSDSGAIGVVQIEAVLAHEFGQPERVCDAPQLQEAFDNGLPHLILA